MSERPRVRFAPSPTGYLHVGNARTALFNWFFARHHGGDFILRLEDTDQMRSRDVFEKSLLQDLHWLMLDWDEGPENDGKFGPYRQSERLAIYNEYIQRLINDGRVYPCYCTEEELEAERMSLLARRMTPRYMGKCRNLSDEKKRELEKEGRKPAFRFKVKGTFLEFKDLIRGAMKFDAETIGDFIILRSTGIPAYNFAVVIDDHLMAITHVIRGEDHLSNTAIQLLLYEALGFKPPVFAHHSLILGKDRTKLSKRHGSVSVREFREKGILPEAFLNYISLLGSSLGTGREICPLDEIIRSFSLARAGKSGAVFDEDKLIWLNKLYIRQIGVPELTEKLLPFIEKAGYDLNALDRNWLMRVVEAIKDNLTTLKEIDDYLAIFLDDKYRITDNAHRILKEGEAASVLKALREVLQQISQPGKNYPLMIKTLEERTGLKGKKLLMPIRAAVTGRNRGPELDRIFVILEPSLIFKRIEKALNLLI